MDAVINLTILTLVSLVAGLSMLYLNLKVTAPGTLQAITRTASYYSMLATFALAGYALVRLANEVLS